MKKLFLLFTLILGGASNFMPSDLSNQVSAQSYGGSRYALNLCYRDNGKDMRAGCETLDPLGPCDRYYKCQF
ncbi:MAG: hypothetical protein MUE81_11750 [Thermoflexibacter sp.]|jgi:hypothetical protein|nr:hypothetical protein [Thermoflexibacter sp.]